MEYRGHTSAQILVDILVHTREEKQELSRQYSSLILARSDSESPLT